MKSRNARLKKTSRETVHILRDTAGALLGISYVLQKDGVSKLFVFFKDAIQRSVSGSDAKRR